MLAIRRNFPRASNPGPPDPGDTIQRSVPMIGGANPFLHQRHLMTQGRYLAGVGSNDDLGPGNRGAPGWGEDLTGNMEDTDDVEGSGIFDGTGTVTVNKTLGVFQDHPSMPGWIARHLPFEPNDEVQDLYGAQVVEIPTGGLIYVDDNNAKLGLMAGGRGSHANISTAGSAPALPRGPGWPDRVFQPTGTIQRPPWTKYFDAPNPPQRVPCGRPRDRRVPMVNTANVAMQQTAVGATADTAPSTGVGWPTLAFVGVLVGGAAAMVYGATQIKPGRSR